MRGRGRGRGRGTHPLDDELTNWPCVEFDVSRQEVSFHLPLHRVLALLLHTAMRLSHAVTEAPQPAVETTNAARGKQAVQGHSPDNSGGSMESGSADMPALDLGMDADEKEGSEKPAAAGTGQKEGGEGRGRGKTRGNTAWESVVELLPRHLQHGSFLALASEHVLRLQVLCAQVQAGMWRRNGQAMTAVCDLYHSVHW